MTALVQEGETAILVCTRQIDNFASGFLVLAYNSDGDFALCCIQCVVQFDICTLGNRHYTTVGRTVVELVCVSLGIIVHAEQEVAVCLIKGLPRQDVAVGIHGLGGIGGLVHRLQCFGVDDGVAVLVQLDGLYIILQTCGNEVIAVLFGIEGNLRIQNCLIVGIHAGCNLFGLLGSNFFGNLAVNILVHPIQVSQESFPSLSVAVLAGHVTHIQCLAPQVGIILGQDVVQGVHGQTIATGVVNLELGSVPVLAESRPAVQHSKAQVTCRLGNLPGGRDFRTSGGGIGAANGNSIYYCPVLTVGTAFDCPYCGVVIGHCTAGNVQNEVTANRLNKVHLQPMVVTGYGTMPVCVPESRGVSVTKCADVCAFISVAEGAFKHRGICDEGHHAILIQILSINASR